MTKIKICGIRRKEDIRYLNETGPDYCGFVFAKSRRQVTSGEAEELRELLDDGITPVGVFVNEKEDVVADMVNRGVIDIAQLHGDEDEDYILQVKALLKRGKIMKAIRVQNEESVLQAEKIPGDLLLFDAYSKAGYGGNGETFCWSYLEKVSVPYFLAGGLGIWNVKKAVDYLHPYGVDLSSAVETDGYKDKEKIAEIINLIRNI